MKVIFSANADQKLLEIYRYIAIENYAPDSAEKLITDIREQTKILADMPKIGRVFTDENTRFLVIKKHVIVYKIQKNNIIITQIYRAGENWR